MSETTKPMNRSFHRLPHNTWHMETSLGLVSRQPLVCLAYFCTEEKYLPTILSGVLVDELFPVPRRA